MHVYMCTPACVRGCIYIFYICWYVHIHVYAHIHMCEFVIPLILVSVS